jgi:hypothetical protein
MLIQVIYDDNHHDFVKPVILDTLIESRKIAKFKRSSGWVTVGMDPVRKSLRESAFLTPGEMRKLSSM